MVLLVDDEAAVRRVTERALQRRGWEVLAADSAEAALSAVEEAGPRQLAAVVTDLVMPGDDGTVLVRALRERLGAPELPAVLISGYASEPLRAEVAAALGDAATVFLPKPYEPQELAERLAELAAASPAPAEAAAG
jgi:two-component system cell cycle sensor histidine kinase/response regulator CckA